MTTNVHITVPDHVAEVHVGFEKYTADGWVTDNAAFLVLKSGQDTYIHITETRRIAMICEVCPVARATPMTASINAPLTINEHAHGHEAHDDGSQ